MFKSSVAAEIPIAFPYNKANFRLFSSEEAVNLLSSYKSFKTLVYSASFDF